MIFFPQVKWPWNCNGFQNKGTQFQAHFEFEVYSKILPWDSDSAAFPRLIPFLRWSCHLPKEGIHRGIVLVLWIAKYCQGELDVCKNSFIQHLLCAYQIPGSILDVEETKLHTLQVAYNMLIKWDKFRWLGNPHICIFFHFYRSLL